MRAMTLLLTATLLFPTTAHAQSAAECDQLIDTVMRLHLKRTQPFYKGAALVSPAYRVASDDDRWDIPDLLRDATVGDLHTADVTSLHLQSNDSFTVAESIDSADADVAFVVSRPRFNADQTYAVVRVDGTVLRGTNAKLAYGFLYGMRRTASGQWTYDRFLAPCCF